MATLASGSQISGVETGGIWRSAENTVLYFAGNEHTESDPKPDVLYGRASDIHDALVELGYDANVMWVVSDEMTTGWTGPGRQVNRCNTPLRNCASLGDDFGAAISEFGAATSGELSGYAHSHASLHVSIAFEQDPSLGDEMARLVFAAGTSIDSDGGTQLGLSDIEVWVSQPSAADFLSIVMAPGSGPKLAHPTDIPGRRIYDSHFASHDGHVDRMHLVFQTAMRLLAGLGE